MEHDNECEKLAGTHHCKCRERAELAAMPYGPRTMEHFKAMREYNLKGLTTRPHNPGTWMAFATLLETELSLAIKRAEAAEKNSYNLLMTADKGHSAELQAEEDEVKEFSANHRMVVKSLLGPKADPPIPVSWPILEEIEKRVIVGSVGVRVLHEHCSICGTRLRRPGAACPECTRPINGPGSLDSEQL